MNTQTTVDILAGDRHWKAIAALICTVCVGLCLYIMSVQFFESNDGPFILGLVLAVVFYVAAIISQALTEAHGWADGDGWFGCLEDKLHMISPQLIQAAVYAVVPFFIFGLGNAAVWPEGGELKVRHGGGVITEWAWHNPLEHDIGQIDVGTHSSTFTISVLPVAGGEISVRTKAEYHIYPENEQAIQILHTGGTRQHFQLAVNEALTRALTTAITEANLLVTEDLTAKVTAALAGDNPLPWGKITSFQVERIVGKP